MNLKPAWFPSAIFVLALALMAGSTFGSEAADSFYDGKVVTLVVGAPAGSGYDVYSRILVEFLPKYIPGHPTIIVQNMPGAAGMLAAGYMYNVAARDGTIISSGTSTVPTYPILHPDIAKFDVTKFSWIGSVTKDIYIAFVWHEAPIQSYEEAKQTQAILGGIALGAPSVDLAVVSNALFGTKFKIVTGYGDESIIKLALERGEIDGSFGGVYSSFKTGEVDWLRENKIKIILQHGLERLPELPDVPLFIDQAKTPDERGILQFMLSPEEFNKPYYAPPGVPADRLDILRHGFDNAVADPGFLAAAAKANLVVMDPMNGQTLSAAIDKVAGTPPALVERIRGMLTSFAQK